MPRETNHESNNLSPIHTSSPRIGRLAGNRSPGWRQTTLDMSFQSTTSIASHVTEPAFVSRRDTSPSGESIRSSASRAPLRERDSNVDATFVVPTLKHGDLAPHPAKLSTQQKKASTQKRRSSNANQSFAGLDQTKEGDDSDFDGEDETKRPRRRLVSAAGRPGRKPIGRRPNMDEAILKKIMVPQFNTEDPFELIRKTRERILGECAQNFFKVYVGNQSDEAYEINLHYRWWAQYNMFFAHEPMSRLITSTRGNIIEIVQRAEDGPSFLVWNGIGVCTRSAVPPFRELAKVFQVRGQVEGRDYTEKAPSTMNQLLINIYEAVTHTEHLQQRFIPIGAAITMNNWVTLANPSDVVIALNRLRHFTRIALDYSAGPQINGKTFDFYFPEAARDIQEAQTQENHPDYRAQVHEPCSADPNPFTVLRVCPEIPRSSMAQFVEHWNRFDTQMMFKSAPLFAFKLAIRHRLFPMTMMKTSLPPSIKDTYKEELKNADKLDEKPYTRGTLMDILKEISDSGWKTLQMLLTRQTDTDEEKLLIQNHDDAPILKLAKLYVRSEQKYGDTYIPPTIFTSDEICIRARNLGGNPDLNFSVDENNNSLNVTTSSAGGRDFDTLSTTSINWNPEVV